MKRYLLALTSCFAIALVLGCGSGGTKVIEAETDPALDKQIEDMQNSDRYQEALAPTE